MVAHHHHRRADEQSLRAIEGTYREVCEELSKSQPLNGCDYDSLRTVIVHRLLKLVEQGITDPIELRSSTLSYFVGQHETSKGIAGA